MKRTVKNVRKVFHGATVITERDGYIITYPMNTWDTNYHLYDTLNKVEYLIDLDEVGSDYSDLEYCSILFNDLLELDLNYLIDYSWKEFNY